MPTLDWLNRDAAFRVAGEVPYRLLEPVSSHGDGDAGNLLIQGDNLEALKALLPLYRAQVKCIFIDPPYNTKSAFEHYDDNLEHSQWLSMMLPRLQLLREFLREDGSIWVTIDDNEGHYLKVLMDEVFGRRNFISSFAWQKTLTRRNDAKTVSAAHDHVLAYGLRGPNTELRRLEADPKQRATYTNRDSDPRGDWLAIPFHAPNIRPNLTYPITTPGGRILMPPPGRCWSTTKELFAELLADNRIYFGRDGNGMAQRKKFWAESAGTVVPWTWWPYDETGENREATREAKVLADGTGQAPFSTPKPEKLLKRIFELTTNPTDLILDSFLGSGTTAAVAHKMGRRWIGIEMGEHAATHCLPRLEKVVQGDQGGISSTVNWQGGGGFRFLRLGETVFSADGLINPQVRFAALAAFVWQQETRSAYSAPVPGATGASGAAGAEGAMPGTPRIGIHDGTALYLLYNGILGDRRPDSGNVLNLAVLQALKATCWHAGPKVLYGEACRLGPARLAAEGIVFRQIPYGLSAR
jgi:adenine-specific DNA-methyltransferase